MSKLGELVDQLAALKRGSDDLEAAIGSTGEIVNDIAGELTNIGAAGKALQVQQVNAELADARNSRWLSEGHLVDALLVLQAVIDGQKGIGTSPKSQPVPGASAGGPKAEQAGTADSPNSVKFTTDLNGQQVEVKLTGPEPEPVPGPSGEKLLKDAEEESETLGRARRAARVPVRNLDDVQDQVKDWASSANGAIRGLEGTEPEVSTGTLQDVSRPDCISPTQQLYQQQDSAAIDPINAVATGSTLFIGVINAALKARKQEKKDGS